MKCVSTIIDDDGNTQTLTIDVNSSDADNAMVPTLILQGSRITVILDRKEDLEWITAAVSAKAPDNATTTAIYNTILSVGASLGGRSVERTSQAPETATPQVDTPPPPLPLPLPSFSVVSPN
jgi:hypothetical protein